MDDELWVSVAECLSCGCEWTAVHPLNAANLECPACGSFDTVRDFLPEILDGRDVH